MSFYEYKIAERNVDQSLFYNSVVEYPVISPVVGDLFQLAWI